MTAWTFRPLGPWTGPETKTRKPHQFSSSWADTLDLLERELDQLDARNVVIQVDCDESDLRRDGMPKANARVDHPGVRISFDSKHGPLTYATDAYESRWMGQLASWQANIRAIALGLQALRAVDRYGVTRSGEQYKGWTALPAGSLPLGITIEQAATALLVASGVAEPPVREVRRVIDSEAFRRSVWRQAALRLHPDHEGGDRMAFERVRAARELLDLHAVAR